MTHMLAYGLNFVIIGLILPVGRCMKPGMNYPLSKKSKLKCNKEKLFLYPGNGAFNMNTITFT